MDLDLNKNNEKNNNNSKKIVMIILLILGLLLIFAGYFVYKNTYTDNTGEDFVDDDESELLYNLDVYKYESGNLCKVRDENLEVGVGENQLGVNHLLPEEGTVSILNDEESSMY